MPDTNLSDDMLKLVRYKVLFIKRDYEHAFPEVEEIVHESMDSTSYTAWKIAEFIQTLASKKTEIPKKWKNNYPDNKDDQGNYLYRKNGMLLGFPEDDKKYLRVYYEVLDRYVRESFRYEEDQIDVLKDIREAIRNIKLPGGPSAPYGGETGGSSSGSGTPGAGIGATGGSSSSAPTTSSSKGTSGSKEPAQGNTRLVLWVRTAHSKETGLALRFKPSSQAVLTGSLKFIN